MAEDAEFLSPFESGLHYVALACLELEETKLTLYEGFLLPLRTSRLGVCSESILIHVPTLDLVFLLLLLFLVVLFLKFRF